MFTRDNGADHRRIELVKHDSTWSMLFKKEELKLENILGAHLIRLHHIGSTSIPDLYSKPVVDILAEVDQIELIDSFNTQFENLGYEVKGEYGIQGRRYFSKGGTNRTHHLHIYQCGNPDVEPYLQFRDYLITHPEEKLVYEDLKKRLAEKFQYNHLAYCQGKNQFIAYICKKAKNP